MGLGTLVLACIAYNLATSTLFACGADGSVWCSTDNGNNWFAAGTIPGSLAIQAVVANALGHVFLATSNGVWRSVDNGTNWTSISIGLTALFITALIIDPRNGYLYAATKQPVAASQTDVGRELSINQAASVDGGIFVSTDNGDTWSPVNAGLTNPDIETIHFSPAGQFFAGTVGGGMVTTSTPTDLGDHPAVVPTDHRLLQNYPNPFNPSTAIAYTLPRAEYVELTIFNTLGQTVITLSPGMQNAGSYTVKWDGLNEAGNPVASGVYFYRLQAGPEASTKSMVLMR